MPGGDAEKSSGAPHSKSHLPCRYRAFREDDGHYSQTYWNLLAIRLAFVIVFEVAGAPPGPSVGFPTGSPGLSMMPHSGALPLSPHGWGGGGGVCPNE